MSSQSYDSYPEPWYQSAGPSDSEVIQTMQTTWFISALNRDLNSDMDNNNLQKMLNIHFKELPSWTQITFEKIKMIPNWKGESERILKEVALKSKPYGSYRGFQTFVVNEIKEKHFIRFIKDFYLRNVIQKLKPYIIEYYYRPENKGALMASIRFNNLSTNK
tara:strand:+ start:2338 stop:2823 length:486 start_codon:yes stop_codon:yes gene_type:complete